MVLNDLVTNGFAVISGVYGMEETLRVADRLGEDLKSKNVSDVRSSRGSVYAARNLVDSLPWLASLWNRPALVDVLRQTLGNGLGLVRVLFFDKPSERSWSLPFHKDMTIAVQDNSIESTHFSKPTVKAGVPHVEASTEILSGMLTLRVHLDDVTEQNGPLQVIPGSHLDGKQSQPTDCSVQKILVTAGDVLAMRPLLSHASGHTDEAGQLRRRILHFEFSGIRDLPDGYRWNRYVSLADL